MSKRKYEVPLHDRAVLETPDSSTITERSYRHCNDTTRILGQGDTVYVQGRVHDLDTGTVLRITAYTGLLCSGEAPVEAGRLVKLSSPTLSNQDYIEVSAKGPYHLWTEGPLQTGVELVFTVLRTGGGPNLRRLVNSACACVHVP